MPEQSSPAMYRVVSVGVGVEEMSRVAVRDGIRDGSITATTEIAPAGTEDWQPASAYPELQRYLELSAARSAAELQAMRQTALSDAETSVSAKRLITYLALGGLTAGWLYVLLLPVCAFMGVFGRYMLSWAVFGAVFGLAVNSAVKVENARVIQISAAGFALGGLIALWLPASGGFAFAQLAIIGLVGAASLGWAMGFPVPKTATIAVAGLLLFPMSMYLYANGAVLAMMRAIVPFGVVAWLLAIIIHQLPFLIFGALVGFVIVYAPAPSVTAQQARLV